jgi:hypothetical protein
MAKKQTRRSISVSRGTYERLKAYCETNQISMSQFVERRVGDYLGRSGAAPQPAASAPSAPAPLAQASAQTARPAAAPAEAVRTDAFSIATQPKAPTTTPAHASRLSSINQPISQAVAAPKVAPKPVSDEPMLKDPDAKLTADQIFTF